MRKRLIAGTINRYPAEDGTVNIHLDKSSRPLADLREGGYDFRPADIVAGIEDIPVPDNDFDEIRCSQTLEHPVYEDAVKAISEFFRVLKPGGLLLLDVPDFDAICRWWVTSKIPREDLARIAYGDPSKGMADDHLNAHRTAWWPERLEADLEAAGFEIESSQVEGVILFIEARKPE